MDPGHQRAPQRTRWLSSARHMYPAPIPAYTQSPSAAGSMMILSPTFPLLLCFPSDARFFSTIHEIKQWREVVHFNKAKKFLWREVREGLKCAGGCPEHFLFRLQQSSGAVRANARLQSKGQGCCQMLSGIFKLSRGCPQQPSELSASDLSPLRFMRAVLSYQGGNCALKGSLFHEASIVHC